MGGESHSFDMRITEHFASEWMRCINLIHKVLESHDHGFVLDGDLVNELRNAVGDGIRKN